VIDVTYGIWVAGLASLVAVLERLRKAIRQ